MRAVLLVTDPRGEAPSTKKLVVVEGRRSAEVRIGFPASAEHLTGVRRAMATWLRGLSIAEHTVSDIVLAVLEACANSVEHAYRHSCGAVRLAAHQDADCIRVTVDDTGRWKPDIVPDLTRGRGLPLMRAISTHFELGTGPTGTRVSMSFQTPPAAST